jgi:hypothetical protein
VRPRLEVVEHHDLVAALDQQVDHVAADEARATRDQDSHRALRNPLQSFVRVAA